MTPNKIGLARNRRSGQVHHWGFSFIAGAFRSQPPAATADLWR